MARVTYDVSFEDDTKPDEWVVSRGPSNDGTMQIVIASPNTSYAEELPPGYYDAQIAIRGTDEKKAKLTITRPVFNDIEMDVTIDPGSGQGINLRSFRVVEGG